MVPFVRGRKTSRRVQIDHIVALAAAWRTGADRWTSVRRRTFANDPQELLAVKGSANIAKSDKDASGWLPHDAGNARFDCAYVASQIAAKSRYGLWVTRAERKKMRMVLASCVPGSLAPLPPTNPSVRRPTL